MNERDDEKLKQLIASNIAYYRKEMNLTQNELAEKIHYSDKSVSKWERGDGVPDICVLAALAELFGVTVNDLLAEKHKRSKFALPKLKHSIITFMSIGLVWLVATVVYFILAIASPEMYLHEAWLAFIIAIPVTFIVTLVLSAVWHPWIFQFVSVSCLIWSVSLALDVASLALNTPVKHMSLIYTIAAAAQVLTILWYLPKAIQFFSKHIRNYKEKKNSPAAKIPEKPSDASDKADNTDKKS